MIILKFLKYHNNSSKYLIWAFSLLISFSLFGHEDITFRKTYGHVKVFIKAPYFYEGINTALIAAQYTDILLHEKHYKDTLELYINYGSFPEPINFDQEKDAKKFKIIRIKKKNRGIQLEMDTYHLDIKELLCLIDKILFSSSFDKKTYKHAEIKEISADCSSIVDKTLARKINRPEDIHELSIKSSTVRASYFIQNNYIHIIYNGQVIDTLPAIFYINLTSYGRLYYMPDIRNLKTYSFADKNICHYSLKHHFFFLRPPQICIINQNADLLTLSFFDNTISYLINHKKRRIKCIYKE